MKELSRCPTDRLLPVPWVSPISLPLASFGRNGSEAVPAISRNGSPAHSHAFPALISGPWTSSCMEAPLQALRPSQAVG